VLDITDPGIGPQQFQKLSPSQLYWQTWKGIRTDRAFQDHMHGVIKHFESLGYQISRQSNPLTNGVFWWKISW
jgi:hypothetical protein